MWRFRFQGIRLRLPRISAMLRNGCHRVPLVGIVDATVAALRRIRILGGPFRRVAIAGAESLDRQRAVKADFLSVQVRGLAAQKFA